MNENLVNTSDFRAMNSALLEEWFKTDKAGLVIPQTGFEAVPQLIA